MHCGFLKFFFLSLVLVFNGARGSIVQTTDFETVRKTANQMGTKYSAEQVLIVFDVDNTLLQMETDLGSDQWFDWQAELLSIEDSHKVAADFAGLLKVQGMLFSIGKMNPPGGEGQVEIVQALKTRFPTIALTSRSCFYEPSKSYSFLDATHRELKRNGYEFESSALEPKGGYGSPFVSYTPDEIQGIQLTEKEKRHMEVASGPRRSCYSRGIYMTAGQHKGLMLRILLQKAQLQSRFRAIIAVDDKEKYCKQYEEALASKVEFHCVRYGATDARVKAFRASDKKAVTNGWNEIRTTLSKHLSIDWK